jgi:hypothetical protein
MANNTSKPRHTMVLPSKTAVALWHAEVTGQISDGMWENSRPFDHWKFWCSMNVIPGDMIDFIKSNAPTGTFCTKKSYALTRLHQIKFEDGGYVLRARMLAYGRMTLAGVDPTDCEALNAAEYMPSTFNEWKECKSSGEWKYDFVNKYMDRIDESLAEKFYKTSYTMKDMNTDLAIIKAAMNLAVKSCGW